MSRARSAMPSRSSHVTRGGPRVGPRETVQAAEVLDLLAHLHARVEPALLGHVAEPAALRRSDRGAVPGDGAGFEVGQPEDGTHRRGLAGTVRAEEADDLSRRHAEREIVQGRHGTVGATQLVEFEQATHRARLGRIRGSSSRPCVALGLGPTVSRQPRQACGQLRLARQSHGMWRSLAARLLWEQEVRGSNPRIPTSWA